jgi:hypothetical protein
MEKRFCSLNGVHCHHPTPRGQTSCKWRQILWQPRFFKRHDGAIMFQIRSHIVKLTMSLILEDVCTEKPEAAWIPIYK